MATSAPSQAEKNTPLILTPSSRWVADYGDNNCSLRRSFGVGDDAVRLELQEWQPGLQFSLVIAGQIFAKQKGNYPVQISFGPTNVGTFERSATTALTTDGTTVLFVSQVTVEPKWQPPTSLLVHSPGKVDRAVTEGNSTMAPTSIGMPAWTPPTQTETDLGEKRATTLTIRQTGGASVVLETGPMAVPLKALRHCTDSLVKAWGIDPDGYKSAISPPVPTGATGNWITADDYPTSAIRAGKGAWLKFVLMVGPDGKVADCRIVSGPGDVVFRKITCDLLRRNGRFSPARNAHGDPVRGHWASSIKWDVPG